MRVGLFSGEEGLWSVAEGPCLPRSALGGKVSAVCGWIPFAAALLEPVAVAVHLQDVDVMGDAVEQSAGEPCRTEYFGQFFEWQFAGDHLCGGFDVASPSLSFLRVPYSHLAFQTIVSRDERRAYLVRALDALAFLLEEP